MTVRSIEMQHSLSTTLTVFIIFVLAIVYWFLKYNWNRRWLYYYGSKMNGPFALPVIGSVHFLVRDMKAVGINDGIMALCKKYEPVVGLWLGPALMVLLTRPRDVEKVFNSCLGKGDYYDFAEPFLGHGLINAPAEKWKRHRKIINMTFSPKIVSSYMDIFVKNAKKMVEHLKGNNDPIDIFCNFYSCSTGIVCDAFLGVDSIGTNERNQYFSWINKAELLVLTRFFNPLLHLNLLWEISFIRKDLEDVTKKAWHFIGKIIEMKRYEQNKDEYIDSAKKKNFLSYLIRLTDEGDQWTNEELMEETQTLLTAGSETMSISESFVMLMVAMHPEVQKKIHQEMDSVFGNSNRDVAVEDLEHLVYLERVIKETLRLFPARPIIFRHVDQNVMLESYVIPKGCTVVVPIEYIHRDPKLWSEPLKFDPDRFAPEEISKQPSYSYMPFSIPPRNCLGSKFAMMSMKVTLATIFRSFEVTSCQYKSVEDVKLNVDVILRAVNGFKVTLKSR